MGAGEGLHSQMDPLVALQIMIPVEALRALVTFEWSIGRGGSQAMRWWVRSIHVLRVGDVSTVEPGQESRRHAAHDRHGTIGVMYIGHDRPVHRRQRIRRPWLTMESQRRTRRAVRGHSCRRMNPQARGTNRR